MDNVHKHDTRQLKISCLCQEFPKMLQKIIYHLEEGVEPNPYWIRKPVLTGIDRYYFFNQNRN